MLHDRHFLIFQRLKDGILQPPIKIVQHCVRQQSRSAPASPARCRRNDFGDYFGLTATNRLFPCRLSSRTASSSFFILYAAF